MRFCRGRFVGAGAGHVIGVLIGEAVDGWQDLSTAWQAVIRFAPGVLAGVGAVAGVRLSGSEQ